MIELHQVSKRFTETIAINNISLKIKQGEIVGLLGPNGAGKTTTIRLIAGILPPSEGKILIDGLDMESAESKIKEKIGYLPEGNPLYEEMTIEEYLQFWLDLKNIPLRKQKEARKFVIENIGLADVYYRTINQLSKGYRQRAGLAQAILGKPEILLLDEPTEGLDPNQRREIHNLVKNLGKNRTVIICSHILSEIVKMCSRVIIIHQGKIVGDDTPENLSHLYSGKQIVEVELIGKEVIGQLKKLPGVEKITKLKSSLKISQYWQIESSSQEDLRPIIFSHVLKNRWQLLTLFRREIGLEEVFAQLTKN